MSCVTSRRLRCAVPTCCSALALLLLQACGAHAPGQAERSARIGRQLSADIAEVMAQNRVWETAVPLLQQGIAEDGNNPRLHRLLGVVLRDRGIFDQALVELELAHRLNPADADTAAAMGILYDLQGRHDAAEAWHRHALDINPSRGDYYNNLGFSLYLAGGHDHYAVVAFRQALRRTPNQARLFNNLGFALARLGEREAALMAFSQGGTRAQALANLGVAFELQDALEDARACYLQALQIDHRSDVARRNLRNLAAAVTPATYGNVGIGAGSPHAVGP